MSSTAWTLAGAWPILVAISRLYVGAHYVQDVLAGAIYTAIMLYMQHSYPGVTDSNFIEAPRGVLLTVFVIILYVLVYPRTTPWSASFGTAAISTGTWGGCMIGLWAGTHGLISTIPGSLNPNANP